MEGTEQEGNGENKSKEDDVEKNMDSDPVVYQLVRVEGDGTLVPATEDEVFHLVEDIENVETFLSDDLLCNKKSDSEGPSQPQSNDVCIAKPDTDLEIDHTHTLQIVDDIAESAPNPMALNASQTSERENTGATSAPTSLAPSNIMPALCASSKPDFSLLRGEIRLDGLSIRELQETFRATFGRVTTVKDKTWLKRRIAMGLTNSCEVPSSNFVIKDNKIVKNEDGSQKRVRVSGSEIESVGEGAAKRMRKPTRRYIEELSDLENRETGARLTSPSSSGKSYTLSDEQMTHLRSRVRPGTPTRQDSFGALRFQIPHVSRVRRCRPRKNFIAFMDYRSRVVNASTSLQQDSDGRKLIVRKIRSPSRRAPQPKLANKEEEKEEENAEAIKENKDSDLKSEKAGSNGENEEEEEEENNDNNDNNNNNNNNNNNEEVNVTSNSTNSNSSSKKKRREMRGGGGGGNMRRKHHRAWTLCEVLKLVEGVARYGAGKWSEIRRLAFASYSYRTSVDLKDKWRNLLRASFAQAPPVDKEGRHARKPTSMPIPSSILLRVRELAEMHSQTGSEFAPTNKKVSGHGRNVVQEKGSGFL